MSSTADPGTATEEAVAETPRDEKREALVEQLGRQLGDDLLGSEVAGADVWIRVRSSAWLRAAEICKQQLHMDYFCFLSGIDWLPAPTMGGKAVWDPEGVAADEPGPERPSEREGSPSTLETGVAGGDTRFQLLARLYSTSTHLGITLKADLDDANPSAPSWVGLYKGADWHEREAWEMYGFTFDGHPGLRHLYLPSGFEGHPLRKDFPMLAREVKPWPGLVDKEPIPGEADESEGEPTEQEGG